LPIDQNLLHIISNRLASQIAIPPCHQVIIVGGVSVADVGSHGKIYRLGREGLGRCGSSNAPAVFAAGVLCYVRGDVGVAARIALSDGTCELMDVSELAPLLVFGRTVASGHPLVRVGHALGLGLFERGPLNEDSLAFVALSATAPLNDDCPELGVLAGPPREGRVRSWQIDKVVEIGTVETPDDLVGHVDETSRRKLLAALCAGGVAPNPEDNDVAPLRPTLLAHLSLEATSDMFSDHIRPDFASRQRGSNTDMS
jgi:hypothetical protein